MSREDYLKYKTYCQKIIDKPRDMKSQYVVREGQWMFCDDWQIIEILKYLFHGKETYFGDPPPRRLRGNPLWSQQAVEAEAEKYLEEYQTSDAIIEALQKRRGV